MTYQVNKTNGELLTNINDGEINTSTSLRLFGRGVVQYGETDAENQIRMLENFANTTSPRNALKGQVWFDTSTNPGTLKVATSDNGPFVEVGGSSTTVGSSVVNANNGNFNIGDTFWDTTKKQLFVWDGSKFILIGPQSINGLKTGSVSATMGNNPVIFVIADGRIIAAWSQQSTRIVNSIDNPPLTIAGEIIGDAENLTSVFSGKSTFSSGLTFATNFGTINANLFEGEATSARYADLAERFKASEKLNKGDVVRIGGKNEIEKTKSFKDTNVLGVISENPGIRMNSGAGEDETHPYVSYTGRIYVNVKGKVNKGDRLVSSDIDGIAVVLPNIETIEDYVSVIGRSLEDNDNNDVKSILMVVGVK